MPLKNYSELTEMSPAQTYHYDIARTRLNEGAALTDVVEYLRVEYKKIDQNGGDQERLSTGAGGSISAV